MRDLDGNVSGPIKYWDIHFGAEDGPSDKEWEDGAEQVIHDSVKAHLVGHPKEPLAHVPGPNGKRNSNTLWLFLVLGI
jgi:hypothetical protein